MINVNQITATLAKLPDPALQQYAAMHKNDPYIMALAVAESNRRKEMRSEAQGMQGQMPQPKVADQVIAGMAQAPAPSGDILPEMQGIGRLPAGDMNFAQGGIVAFADEGLVKDDLFRRALEAEGVTDPREQAFLRALHAQESSGQNTAKTSNRGARGAMQILPSTFSEVADSDWNIDDPLQNMRAGIRYGRKGLRAAGGDPVLGGAFYYGGPGGLDKARKGQAAIDPANPTFPNTLAYGKSIAQRMTDLLPIGSAQAEERTPRTPKTSVDQIPTGGITAPAAKPVQKGIFGRIGDALGLSEDTQRNLSNLNMALAGATGAGYFPNYLGKGEGITGALGQTGERIAERLGLTGKAPLSAAQIKALQAENSGVQALRAAQEAQEAAALTGAMPGEARLAGQAAQAAKMASAPQKMSAAERIAQASQAREVAAVNRAQALASAATPARLAATGQAMGAPTGIAAIPAPGEADDGSYDRLEQTRLRNRSFDAAEDAKKEIIDAAKEATPGKKGKGFTGEDWLMLGLGMMASKSPRFLQAVGEGGLQAMKARQDRTKEEREAAMDEMRGKYYGALGEHASAQAEELRSGNKKPALAMAMVDKLYDNWLNTEKANPLNQLGINPEKANAAYQQILQNVFKTYNIPVPDGLGPVGAGISAQLTPADRALIDKYTAR